MLMIQLRQGSGAFLSSTSISHSPLPWFQQNASMTLSRLEYLDPRRPDFHSFFLPQSYRVIRKLSDTPSQALEKKNHSSPIFHNSKCNKAKKAKAVCNTTKGGFHSEGNISLEACPNIPIASISSLAIKAQQKNRTAAFEVEIDVWPFFRNSWNSCLTWQNPPQFLAKIFQKKGKDPTFLPCFTSPQIITKQSGWP